MSWSKLDDRLDTHPKLLRAWGAEPAAVGLWTFGLTYSARNELSGLVPEEALLLWRPPEGAVEALLSAGLWRRVDGGFEIHDFGEYNPTGKLREVRSRAGAKGGKKSGQTRRRKARERKEAEAE